MNPQLIGTAATFLVVFASAAALGAPAWADPRSAGSTTVVMPKPGPRPSSARGGPDEPLSPPGATLSVQFVDGSGVDRDGTEGFVNPGGTDGIMTGPLMVARPQLPAPPPLEPARIKPLRGI